MNEKELRKRAIEMRRISKMILLSDLVSPQDKNRIRIIYMSQDIDALMRTLVTLSAEPNTVRRLPLELSSDVVGYLGCVKAGLTRFLSDFTKRRNDEKY